MKRIFAFIIAAMVIAATLSGCALNVPAVSPGVEASPWVTMNPSITANPSAPGY